MSTTTAVTEFETLQKEFDDLIAQRSAIESEMEELYPRLNELDRAATLKEFSSLPFPKSIKTDADLCFNSDFIGEALGLEGDALTDFVEKLDAQDSVVIEILISEDLSISFGPITVKPRDSEESGSDKEVREGFLFDF